MKKIASILLIVSILLSLCSCQLIQKLFEPTHGMAIWDRIDREMDALDSYTSKTDATISVVNSSGIHIKGTTSGETIVVGAQSGDFYMYQLSSTELTAKVNDYEEKSSSLILYDKGNMYLYNRLYSNTQNESKSLYSEMSEDDFLSYINQSDLALSPEGCSNVSFSKSDDGSIEGSYSGFGKERTEAIANELGFYYSTFGVTIADVRISIIADSDYRLNKMIISLVSNNEITVFDATIIYSDFNCSEKKEVDTRSYIKVDDVRVVNAINIDMNNALSRAEGGFMLSISHSMDTKSGTNVSSYEETDAITYRVEDGKYSYDISARTTEQSILMKYSDGKQETYINGMLSSTKSQKELEAMAFIASLMNNSGYSPMAVHDVERLEDGVYKLTVRTGDTTAYRNIMQSYKDNFVSYECFFIATFGDDGVLNTLESELVISGNKYDYTVKSKLEINKE